MTREEFNIALDLSLTKDRVTLCLDYINELEDRICDFEAKLYNIEQTKQAIENCVKQKIELYNEIDKIRKHEMNLLKQLDEIKKA